MAKDKDYDWKKANWWDYPEDDDVEVKEIEIDLDKFLLPKEYAYGGGVGHLMEPSQTYHQYHDFTAPMTVGAMVDNMYNRGGRVNLYNGGNPHAGGYKSSSSKSVGGKGRGRQDPMGGHAHQTAAEMRAAAPDQFGGGMNISHGGGDGNKLVDTTNYPGKVTEKVVEKFYKPPVDKTNEFFSNLKKYQTLNKNDGLGIGYFRNEGPKKISKELLTNALSTLSLEYPDIKIQNKDGFINTENLKAVVDSAILDGKISPMEGLTLTQSIGTEGDPSGIGVDYSNNFLNFNTGDIGSGTYGLGTNYNLGDLNLKTDFNVVNDNLDSKKLAFDYGDGTLTGSQQTYPNSKFQINEAELNKDFNINDNFKVGIDGKVKNLKSDGSTLFTDQSLTPSLTFNKNIGDGKLSANISKEIIEGGDTANLGVGYNNNGFYARGDDLLSEDRTGIVGYQKNIGDFTDDGKGLGFTVGGEKNIFDDEWTAGLGLNYKFNKGGRVALQNGSNWWDNLSAPGMNVYNAMKDAGHDDATIQGQLSLLGYYDADAGTPDPTPDPTPGQGGGQGGSGGDSPYAGQVVDQTDYSFNKKNYAPGGKLEVNPAALGMSFEKASPPQGIINQVFQKPGRTLTSFASPTTGGNITGPAEEGFMSQVAEGIAIDPAGRTREELRQLYDNYGPWLGRKSNYANARVPGKGGQIIGGIVGAAAGIPGLGFLGGIGSGKDKSMQSKYGVEGGFGGGNTKFRDEFGLSVVDDSKRLFGKRDRNYLDRMEEQMGKSIDFFGGTRTSLFGGKKLDKTGSSVENFAERWANFDDLDAADQQALINEMKAINSFKAKQMLAYKNRIATEKIDEDWKQQQKDIKDKKKQQEKLEAATAAQKAQILKNQQEAAKFGDKPQAIYHQDTRSQDRGGRDIGSRVSDSYEKQQSNQYAMIAKGGIAQYAPKKKGIASMFTRRR